MSQHLLVPEAPDKFLDADGPRGSTGGRFADTQRRELAGTLSAPTQFSDREFVCGFPMGVQLVGHQVKGRASTE